MNSRVRMMTRFYLSLWFLVQAIFVLIIPKKVILSAYEALKEITGEI